MAARASNGFVSLPCQFVLQAAKVPSLRSLFTCEASSQGSKKMRRVR